MQKTGWVYLYLICNLMCTFVTSEGLAGCQQGHGNCPCLQAYPTGNERKLNLFNCQVITLPVPQTLGHQHSPAAANHWIALLSPLIQKRGWFILLLGLDRWNKQKTGGKSRSQPRKNHPIQAKECLCQPSPSGQAALSFLSFLIPLSAFFGRSSTRKGCRPQRERVNTSVQCIIFSIEANKAHKSSPTAVSPLGNSLK